MTKEQFERYPFILRQIRKLSQPVQDTVVMSSKEFPWGTHISAISGQQDSELLRQYKAEKQEIEAFINSMTPEERDNPQIINSSRKKRIAKGCGMDLSQINQFISQFDQMRKMMKGLTGMTDRIKQGKMKMPKMPGGFGGKFPF